MKKIYFLVLAFIVLLFYLLYNNTYEGFESILNPGESNVASKQPLIDANRDDPQWNKGFKAGYDPEDQNIGKYTALDKMFYMDNLNNQGKNYKKLKKMESMPRKSTKIGTVGNGFLESTSKKISNLLKTDEEEKKEEILSEKQQKIQASLRKMLDLEEELKNKNLALEQKDKIRAEISKTKDGIKTLTIESLELNENINIKNVSNQVLQSEIDLLLTTESDEQEKVRLQEIIKEINDDTFEKLTAEKKSYSDEQELDQAQEQALLDESTVICNSKHYTGYSGDCFDKCFEKYESQKESVDASTFYKCYTKFSEKDKIDGTVYIHPDYTTTWVGNINASKKKEFDVTTLNSCANSLANDKTGFYLDENNDCIQVNWETENDALVDNNFAGNTNFVFFKPFNCVGSHKPDDCPIDTGIKKFEILKPKRHFGEDCANNIGDELDCGKDQRTDCSTTEWIVDSDKIEERTDEDGWWKKFKRDYTEQTYGGKECTDKQKIREEWRGFTVLSGHYVNDDGMGVTKCAKDNEFYCEDGKKKQCGGDKVASKDKATKKSDCKVPVDPGYFYDAGGGGTITKCTQGSYCLGGYETSQSPCGEYMTSLSGSYSQDACTVITCEPGKYYDTWCKTCAEDTYCPAAPGTDYTLASALPYECLDGKTTGGKKGMTQESDCKPTCEAGEYWDSTTNTCETCRKKKYCKGGWGDNAKEEECGTIDGAHKYETRIKGATSRSDCKKWCSPGNFLNDSGVCQLCKKYSKPEEGNIYYCGGGWDGDDDSKPKKCPANTEIKTGVSAGGDGACLDKCSAGTYWNGTSCSSECKVDHYCEGGVQTEAQATSCGTGKTTYGGKTATSSNDCLDLCEAGKYFHSPNKTCRVCQEGYYCEGGKHNSQCPVNARDPTPAGGEPQKKLSDCKVKPGWTWDGTVSTVPVMCLENHYCEGGKPSKEKGGQIACPSGKTVAAGDGKTAADCASPVPSYPALQETDYLEDRGSPTETGDTQYEITCGLAAYNKTRIDADSGTKPSNNSSNFYGFKYLSDCNFGDSNLVYTKDGVLQAKVGDKIELEFRMKNDGYKEAMRFWYHAGDNWRYWADLDFVANGWSGHMTLPFKYTWTVPSRLTPGNYAIAVSNHWRGPEPDHSDTEYTSCRVYSLHIVE